MGALFTCMTGVISKKLLFVAICAMGGLCQNLLLEHTSAHSHDLAVPIVGIIKSIVFPRKENRQMLVEKAAC